MDKKNFSSGKGGRLALVLATAVLSLGLTGSALAGISATKHNLSTSGTGTNKLTAGTDQICVFCHTPHGSDNSAAVPLWNKTLPASNTFTLYNSVSASATSSLDGQVLAVGSVSLACLSCHDGAQAMDNVVNAPGSGKGSGAIAGATWTGGNQTAGALSVGIITNIGKDLTNDHPIGIQYCGGGLTGSASAVSGTCKDSDFVGATANAAALNPTSTVKTASVNSRQIFWVETGADGSGRQKTDIALYTRDFTSAAGTPSVECGSCHDPHVESKGTDNIMFMRVTTAGSAICLSCHVK